MIQKIDFILATLYITEMPSDIYCYKNTDGIKVVYYTLDMEQLIEKNIYAPLYYQNDDILQLDLSEPHLYRKAIENTGKLLPGTIISFADYLEGCIEPAWGITEKILIHTITEKLHILPEDEKVWCLTNNMSYAGAIGFYQISVLQSFCHEQNFSRIIIGVGNRDYGYILNDSPKNQKHIVRLLDSVPDFIEENGTLQQSYIFIFNNETNKLTQIF